MHFVRTIAETKAILHDCRSLGHSIGLVPTMGAYHEGHLSLMRQARTDCDCVVVSLFVNPTQFGPGEDYEQYPRDLERDRELAEQIGVSVLFAPEVEEMYPRGDDTHVEVEELTKGLCGRFRPGHFRGVTTVVLKLFNIVSPDRAYFGEKDYQQLKAIQRMVRDLHLDIDIVPMPIVREPDGLAMSSRNEYLSAEQRQAALAVPRSLTEAQKVLKSGQKTAAAVRGAVEACFAEEELAQLQYAEVVDAETLEPLEAVDRPARLAIAALIGETRLIDNCPLNP